MTKPIVSVILPVYNGQTHVREAIESLTTQSLREVEILVIDDGSTDRTAEIVSSIQDARIQLIRQSNQGLVSKLNFGLAQARGKYIARMDADDISLPTRLSKQVSFLEQHPSIGVCGTASQSFTQTGKTWITKQPLNSDVAWATLLLRVPLSHPTVMFRGDLMRAGHWEYSTTAQHAEDYDLWARLGERTKIGNIGEVLLRYRVHQQQVSTQYAEIQNNASNQIRRSLLEKLGLTPSPEELRFHEDLASGSWKIDSEFLTQFNTWTLKISERNLITKRYTQHALQEVFRPIWIGAALYNIRSGAIIRKIQSNNPLLNSQTQYQLQLLKMRSWIGI